MDNSEVICISSDDEVEIQQNNSKAGKQDQSKRPTVLVGKGTGATQDNKDKKESNLQKRKFVTVDNTDNARKRIKLKDEPQQHEHEDNETLSELQCSSSNDKTSETKNENEKDKEEKSKMIKPKLVVKERRSITQIEQDTFPMLISLCLQKDRSDEMNTIVNKLKRRYEQLDPVYANSEAFKTFLNQKRNEIMEHNSTSLYGPILEVMTEMKNNSKDIRRLSLNGANSTSRASGSNTGVANGVKRSANTMFDEKDRSDTHSQKEISINKILRTMNKCKMHIKKFEEAEINFDDDNNSNYIKAERYKQRMVELYYKYCELSGEHADAGRPYLRPKHLNSTGIVAVDQAINSFINAKISKRHKMKKVGAFADAVIFPNYRDIWQCVAKCNDSQNLGLSVKMQQQIAKQAFADLGEHLQRVRRSDYWDTFSLYLDNADEDPATRDTSLANKLMENKREGEKKLANLFQEYVNKQEELKEEPEEDEESVQDEEEVEEEEDKEEDEEEVDLDISDSDSSSNEEQEQYANQDEIAHNSIHTNSNQNSIKDKTDDDIIEINEVSATESSAAAANHVLIIDENTNLRKSVNKNVNPLSSESNSSVKINEKSAADTALTEKSSCSLKISSTASDAAKESASELVSEDKRKDTEPMEERPPLLRVRSFAKTPVIWNDGSANVDESSISQDGMSKRKNETKPRSFHEGTKQNSSVGQSIRLQLGTAFIPVKIQAKTNNFALSSAPNTSLKPRVNHIVMLRRGTTTTTKSGSEEVKTQSASSVDRQVVFKNARIRKIKKMHYRVAKNLGGNVLLTGPRSLLPNR